ncbi:MAG: rRNA maturation RNase YbeY, partial [Bowdeniella nasicola]|nr:rRNA maturation RNase YbeY [Bowdeniella nasicola]
QAEAFIRIVDEPTIAELHERWLDLPGPTDVMSFPIDELRPGRSPHDPSECGILGDIVLCPTVAARQAHQAGHSLVEEMLLLTCHGLLHLLGFDHATSDDEAVMFALQRKLLLTFLAGR